MGNTPSNNREYKLHKMSDTGPNPVNDGIYHYIPLMSTTDTMGVFKVDSQYDYILNVSSVDYFEVCIYKYPSWKIIFSDTNIKELHLGFLSKGNYSLIVHSIDKVKGVLKQINKNKSKKPKKSLHKKGTSNLYNYVAEMYSDIATIQRNKGLRSINKDFTSNHINSWPKMKYTKIEQLEITPECKEAIIVCVDKNLLKIIGNNEPKLIAQYNNLCAYSIPGNQNYKITHIHMDIEEDEEHLPFYVYCFQ